MCLHRKLAEALPPRTAEASKLKNVETFTKFIYLHFLFRSPYKEFEIPSFRRESGFSFSEETVLDPKFSEERVAKGAVRDRACDCSVAPTSFLYFDINAGLFIYSPSHARNLWTRSLTGAAGREARGHALWRPTLWHLVAVFRGKSPFRLLRRGLDLPGSGAGNHDRLPWCPLAFLPRWSCCP